MQPFKRRGLILPARFRDAEPPHDPAGCYLTLEDVRGAPSSTSDLVVLLSKLQRSAVIGWVSSLIEVVSRGTGYSPAVQKDLVNNFLDPELRIQVHKCPKHEPHWSAFHRRQLWLLLQMALIVCREDVEPIDEQTTRFQLGLASLMASDLLRKIEEAQFDSPDETNSLQWLIGILISHVDVRSDHALLARGYAIWLESMNDPDIAKLFSKLKVGTTFDDVFIPMYGLPLREFFFIAASLYFQFLAPTLKSPVSAALIDGSIYSDGIMTDDAKKRVFDLLSIPVDLLAPHLFGTPRQSWATDSSPLQPRPLIEVRPNEYCCPDLLYFRLIFVDGISRLMQDACKSKEWPKFFGQLYEWYITQVIASFSVASSFLAKTFYTPTKFKGTTDEVCDGLLVYSKTAFLCECKGKRLTARERSAVQMDATLKAIKDGIASDGVGVGQLAKSLRRILSGETVICGNETVDFSSCEQLVPVIVWNEDAGCNHAVQILLQQVFDELLKCSDNDRNRIGPVLLFSTADVEAVAAFANSVGAERLLCEHLENVRRFPRDPNCMFRSFLRTRYNDSSAKGIVDEKLSQVFAWLKSEHDLREFTEPTPEP